MEQGGTNGPKDFYSQASEVLGEEFWQEIGDLLPNPGPRIDMYYTQAEVVVLAELPGLGKPDQIKVQLRGQTLELEGELPCPYPVTRSRITMTERFFGDFRRSLPLPKPVSAENIKAKYAGGLLVVTLPIDESQPPPPIPVEFAAANSLAATDGPGTPKGSEPEEDA